LFKISEHLVILDIGCGSGNTAKLLSDELKYDRIIGVDIDPDMIEFARINNQIENTEYIVQDISNDWDLWDEKLKKLAGKVSVIFSNYCLHWINDIERTAINISHLISNTGIIVVDVLYCGDIYRNVTNEERKKFNQILKYPTDQKVIGRWITAFKNAGLTKINIKYWEPKSIYPQKYYFEGIFFKNGTHFIYH
jgi:SAM-dependent methyltransferase